MTEAVSTPSRRLPPADVLAGSKAQLIAALAETLKGRGLTQVRAAQLCGTDQPTLSKVLTGRSDRVTVDKLMRWLAALDRPVGLQVAGAPATPDVVSPDAEGWPALADAVPCLLWVNRPDGTLLYCNRRVRDRYGERFGRDRAARDRIIHPTERPLFDALRREATAEDRDFEIDLRLEDGDGGYRWHRLLVSPIRDASGAPRALAGAAIEIDDHKKLEAALTESEERFRLATEAFQGGVSDHDAATNRVERTKRHLEIIGETSATFPAVANAWYERIHPEDRPAYDEARRPLFEHHASQYEAEYRIRHRDGHWVWIWHRAIAQRDADGRLERVIGSLIDITERKKAEEQRELLIHELNHRVKNTLATVQSLAAQTLRSAANFSDFTAAFEARLFALSKTHNLLTEGAWAGASLRALLEVEIEPYAQGGEAGRISLAGLHDVHLGARAAVALGLAFHELATNAVKYGALSNETGSVSVMWTLENAAREHELLLHLIWTEQGGPPVEKPRRRGFGTRLIERGIRLDLGGEVELEHRPEGLRCEMHVPLEVPTIAFVPAPVMGTPPLQNRVTPFGALLATPARGLLFGNRGGRFHDPATRALRTRRWASKQWICCVLAFKGRHRNVWQTGYTELFFLDEVTALAAGHRPCCECRRTAARGFQAALLAAGMTPLSLDEIDARLDAERRDGRAKQLHRLPASKLPDGAMIALGAEAFAVRGEAILPWSPAGYGAPRPRPSGFVDVLTPPLTLAALAGGYAPLWHSTAAGR